MEGWLEEGWAGTIGREEERDCSPPAVRVQCSTKLHVLLGVLTSTDCCRKAAATKEAARGNPMSLEHGVAGCGMCFK